MQPTFFATPAKLRAWLKVNHATAQELWVGFYKVDSGKPSITWPESVDEALCFSWIDGVHKNLDPSSYVIRFTPRKPRSTWSAVNIKRVGVLIVLGRMQAAGLKAFEARRDDRSAIYSYEQRHHAALNDAETAHFQANKPAWDYFHARPPSYRKTALWWVVSAKKDETRVKRLATLIDDSAHERLIAPLAWSQRPKKADKAG